MNPELAAAIIASAQRLGVDPLHIGTAISYETGGKFDPNLWGGKNNNHLGLIQFGGPEREKYGVREGQTAVEQMTAVENYLRDRGVKPGMGLLDIYSTINAGRPGLYNRSDAANGGAPGTVRDKVEQQMAGHVERARALLGGAAPVGALSSPPARAGVEVAAPAPVGALTAGIDQGQVAAPATASAAVSPPGSSLASLGAAMGKLGGQMQGQADFLPEQQIQFARPNTGQSQQIAAALAKAYGLGGLA